MICLYFTIDLLDFWSRSRCVVGSERLLVLITIVCAEGVDFVVSLLVEYLVGESANHYILCGFMYAPYI